MDTLKAKIVNENLNKQQQLKKQWIAEAAYYRSLDRNLTLGSAAQDWIEAENKFNDLVKKRIKPGLIRIV